MLFSKREYPDMSLAQQSKTKGNLYALDSDRQSQFPVLCADGWLVQTIPNYS